MSVEMQDRMVELERRLRRTQAVVMAMCLVAGLLAMGAMVRGEPEVLKEIRACKLVVVDDKGVERVVIGQEPAGGERSRATGITIHDGAGTGRGVMATYDDNTAMISLDAPAGVGKSFHDRIGMVVGAEGTSSLLLLDNEGKGVVRLYSDGKGGGGPQVFKWDDAASKVHVKTFTFDGERVDVRDRGK